MILSPPSPPKSDLDSDDPDAVAIKTVLAIQHIPLSESERAKSQKPYIILEVRDEGNKVTAGLVSKKHDDLGKTHIVGSGDTIARIIAQTCRQTGMSEIYTDLLNVTANQIYFVKVEAGSKLIGATFEDALYMLPHAVLIGLKRKVGKNEKILNPDMNDITTIKADDQIIVIAASMKDVTADSYKWDGGIIEVSGQSEQQPDKTLILGWNNRGNQILTELNSYIESEFESKFSVLVVASQPNFEATQWRCTDENGKKEKKKKLNVNFQQGDPTSRVTLEKLNIGKYRHIIVLGDHDLPPQKADWNTLVTLINLRNIKRETIPKLHAPERDNDRASLSIVSEMLVDSNSKLAEARREDDFGGHDFIVSDKLISSYMTQIACNENLQAVFEELLTEKGMEIYLKPAASYVELEKEVNFYEVIAAAARYNECAIGYRKWDDRHESEKQYGVKINPPKTKKLPFEKDDCIIVVAEKECSVKRQTSPESSN